MDALLFALSLEVVLLQMGVLNFLNVEKNQKWITTKCRAEGCTDLRAKAWSLISKQEQLQFNKLLRDREIVKDVIRRTLIEVADSGEWCTLQRAVDYLKQRESSLVCKKRDQEQLRISLEAIKEEIKIKQITWKINLRDADSKIAALRDRINDDVVNANTRLCYAEKWLLARAECLDLEYDVPRPPMPRPDHEERVHNELLKAYELQIQEREKSLEYWERRYATDIVIMNERVIEKSEQLHIATNRRIDLQKIYDLHEGEMRAWLTFKRERAARLAREERQRASVTRIQAWWRGVMVRRAFGAFKYLKNTKKAPVKSKKK